MIRATLSLVITLSAVPADAMIWFCTAALVPARDHDALPYSPTVLELDLNDQGHFIARGEDRYGADVIAFDWDGSWVTADGQLALIGAKRTETQQRTEMRAMSTHVGQNELILNLTETAPWTQNMRCLTHDLS